MSNTTVCIVCKKQKIQGATKCTECGSFQDWRRYLDIGNTSFALIIAFVSVSTVLISTVDKAWIEDESIKVNLVESGRTQLAIAVTNSGEEPAVISPQATLVNKDIKSFAVNIYNDSKYENADLTIKPGEVQVMTAQIPPVYNLDKISTKDCHLLVSVHRLDGETRFEEAHFPCEVVKL